MKTLVLSLLTLTTFATQSASAQSYLCDSLTHDGLKQMQVINPIEVNQFKVDLGDLYKVKKMNTTKGLIISMQDGNKIETSPEGLYSGLNILTVRFSDDLEKFKENDSIMLDQHGTKLPNKIIQITTAVKKEQETLLTQVSDENGKWAFVSCKKL